MTHPPNCISHRCWPSRSMHQKVKTLLLAKNRKTKEKNARTVPKSCKNMISSKKIAPALARGKSGWQLFSHQPTICSSNSRFIKLQHCFFFFCIFDFFHLWNGLANLSRQSADLQKFYNEQPTLQLSRLAIQQTLRPNKKKQRWHLSLTFQTSCNQQELTNRFDSGDFSSQLVGPRVGKKR